MERKVTRWEFLNLLGTAGKAAVGLYLIGCGPETRSKPQTTGGPPRAPGEQTSSAAKFPEPTAKPIETIAKPISELKLTPEASSNEITFEFGEGVTPQEQKEIKDGVTLAQEYLFSKAGIKIGGVYPEGTNFVYVFASSNPREVVDKYLKRTTFAPKGEELKTWRENMEKYATAFVGGRDKRDIFIITTNDGWTKASPIIGGPIAEGRIHTLVHEFCHLLQIEVGVYNTPPFPHWLNEGWAHYVAARALDANKVYPYARIRAGHLSEAGKIRESLESMESSYGFYEAVTPGIAEEYSLGFLATEFLVKDLPNEGIPALAKFWQETGKRKSPAEPWQPAFQIAFGKTPGQFYSDFEAWRRQQTS